MSRLDQAVAELEPKTEPSRLSGGFADPLAEQPSRLAGGLQPEPVDRLAEEAATVSNELDVESIMFSPPNDEFADFLPFKTTENAKNRFYYDWGFGVKLPEGYKAEMLPFDAANAITMERGFFNKVMESARRGNQQVMLDVAAYESLYEGKGEMARIIASKDAIEQQQELDPIEGSFLAELVYGAANILPGMAQGYNAAASEAAAGMVTGAMIGGAAGAPVGVIGAGPGAAGGAVTGLSVGLAVGSSQFWYKQGAGSMATAMIQKGFDLEVSKRVAAVAAVPYAAIEFLQASQVTPGLRQGIQKGTQKAMLEVVEAAVKKYGSTWSSEVVEEVLQEVIQMSAIDTAEVLSEGGITIDKDFLSERSSHLAQTAWEAGKSMALLPLPGAGIDIASGTRSVLAQQKRLEINSKLNRKMADEFTAEEKENIKRSAEIQATELSALGSPTDKQSETLQFLKENANDADALILGFGMERPATTQTDLTGQFMVDTANGSVKKLLDDVAAVEPDQDGFRKLTFETAQDANNASDTIAAVAEAERASLQIDVSGKTLMVKELSPEEVSALTLPSIADQRRNEVERRLRAGEEISPRLREEFADLVKEIESEEVAIDEAVPEPVEKVQPTEAVPVSEIARPEPVVPEAEKAEEVEAIPTEADIEAVEGKGVAVKAEKPPTLIEKKEEAPPKVKPISPIKIVSPGEAGPFKKTFKATEGLPATKVMVDPKVRNSVQAVENRIANLKTRLKQAKVDKKFAVTKATQKEIAKKESQIATLKARQEIKLADSIQKGKVRLQRLQTATKFSDDLRRDAISLVRAIPKDIQKDFFKRASEVKSLSGIKRIAKEIDSGIQRIERRDAKTELRSEIKKTKKLAKQKVHPDFQNAMDSMVKSLKFAEVDEVKQSDLKEIRAAAQDVIDTVSEDSVLRTQAQATIADIGEQLKQKLVVADMSAVQIEQLTDMLRVLREQATTDTIMTRGEESLEAVRRVKEMKSSLVEIPEEAKEFPGAKKVRMLHDNMESALDALSGGTHGSYQQWQDERSPFARYVYDILDAGVDQQSILNRKAEDVTRQLIDKWDISWRDIRNWTAKPEDANIAQKALGIGKPDVKVYKFELLDAKNKKKSFDFSANELMSIFMATRNAHNLEVITREGYHRKAKGRDQFIQGFTFQKLDEMIDALTDKQKGFAKDIGNQLLDGVTKKALNQTSLDLDNFEIAKVNNYWPANRFRSGSLRGKKTATVQSFLESAGFLKQRIGTGGNPMKLTGFFETTYKVSKNASAYAGLARPLREIKAVWNPMVRILEEAGRGAEATAITEMLARFETTASGANAVEGFFRKRLANFGASILAANPKVSLRQRISEFLVDAYVETKYLSAIKPTATQREVNAVREISPQMADRFDGYQFDRDVGDYVADHDLMSYYTGRKPWKAIPLAPMRYFDTQAIVDVYRIAKAELAGKNPKMKQSSPQFQLLLKQRFEWLTRHTQPVWNKKDRALLSTDKSLFLRGVTIFSSQREQMVRMVTNATTEYINSDKTVDDKRTLAKVYSSVAKNMVLFTIYNTAFRALTKKELPEPEDIVTNFLSDVAGLPFFGKYLGAVIQATSRALRGKPSWFQSVSDPFVSMADDIISASSVSTLAAKNLIEGNEKWKSQIVTAVDLWLEAFAQLGGIPYTGPKQIIDTVKSWTTTQEKKRSNSRGRRR